MCSKTRLLKIASAWALGVSMIGSTVWADEPPRGPEGKPQGHFHFRIMPQTKEQQGAKVAKKTPQVSVTREDAPKAQTPAGKVPSAEVLPVAKYWVGIVSRELDEPLRLQLSLDHGLLVDYLAPESPGVKFGLALYDIVLEVEKKQLKSPEELHLAIEASGGKELQFSILRAGKEQSLSIKPDKMPTNRLQTFFAGPEGVVMINNFVESMRGDVVKVNETLTDAEGAAVELRAIGPKVYSVVSQGDSPASVTVDVQSLDNASIKFIIKQDGKELWEGNQATSKTLPAEVRNLLAKLIGCDLNPQVQVPPQTQEKLDELTELLQQMLQKSGGAQANPAPPQEK